MHRLPEKPISRTKFIVPLADVVSHLASMDRLTRVPKIIILIMTLKILIISWFGDWEMGKCGLLLCLEVLNSSSECGCLMRIVRGS